jgi:hypothetical protein
VLQQVTTQRKALVLYLILSLPLAVVWVLATTQHRKLEVEEMAVLAVLAVALLAHIRQV